MSCRAEFPPKPGNTSPGARYSGLPCGIYFPRSPVWGSGDFPRSPAWRLRCGIWCSGRLVVGGVEGACVPVGVVRGRGDRGVRCGATRGYLETTVGQVREFGDGAPAVQGRRPSNVVYGFEALTEHRFHEASGKSSTSRRAYGNTGFLRGGIRPLFTISQTPPGSSNYMEFRCSKTT